MTGIDRLRTLAGAWDEWGLGGTLAEMADEIERERACDSDTAENIRLIVGGVIDDMERHVSGVEGMEDSPVARWARELRRALKSDTSDERGAQNPSCTDAAEAADVTSDTQKVTRDPADDVSMSAYDLLPQEDRDAIAWVREHGGLDSVKKLLDWVVGHCSTKQQLDFDFWLSGRVMYELGFEEDMADRDEVERRLLARLMPDGMEWPTVDGKPVDFVTGYEPSLGVLEAVSIYSNGACEVMGHDGIIKDVKEIHVVTPKVLDADGVEIRKVDTVWTIKDARKLEAIGLYPEQDSCPVKVKEHKKGAYIFSGVEPSDLTHRAPGLAADGKPLEVGQTVYHIADGKEYTVEKLFKYGAMVTHDGITGGRCRAEYLTHERPESWERLEDDAEKDPCGYFGFDGEEICGKCPASGKNCEQTMALDLVRRARALAERERGE